MKKFIALLFLTFLLGSISHAQVKIGLPAGTPQTSSIVDLSNTGDPTKGLALPRVTNTASIVTPVNGMLVYDLSSNCTKVYDNGAWSNCLSTPASAATVNCASSALNSKYLMDTVLTAANTVTIIVNNTSSTTLTINTSITDVYLSGIGAAGMAVTSVAPATLNLAANGTSTITYSLSGTPTTPGSFTAAWTKLGLTCIKTGNVCVYVSPITVSSTTTPLTLPIPAEAGNAINFTAAGGTPNTVITWVITSIPSTGIFSSPATGTGNTAQVILVAGVYNSSVTATFTATNACGVVTGTKTVNLGDQLRIALIAAGCTSCAAYDATAADTWVNITAAEYAQIDNYMPVNIGACNNVIMDTTGITRQIGWTWLSLGTNVSLLPANNYVVAFSTINTNGVASSTGYVKYSTSPTDGFTMSGPKLNVGTTAPGARIYFIMKKPSAVINASASSYVAYYSGTTMQATAVAMGDMNYNTLDDPTLPITSNTLKIKYQIKSTANKRW